MVEIYNGWIFPPSSDDVYSGAGIVHLDLILEIHTFITNTSYEIIFMSSSDSTIKWRYSTERRCIEDYNSIIDFLKSDKSLKIKI